MPKKIYKVKVLPRAKRNKVEKLSKDELKVWLTAPPVDNKANFTLIDILAGYFNVKPRQVAIITGARSQNKKIEISL